MKQLIDQYREWLGLAGKQPRLIDNQARALERVTLALPGLSMEQEPTAIARSIITALDKNLVRSNGTAVPLANSTRRTYIQNWISFLEWVAHGTHPDHTRQAARGAMDELRYLKKGIPAREAKDNRENYLTVTQFRAFLNGLRKDENKSLILTMYATAGRVLEVAQYPDSRLTETKMSDKYLVVYRPRRKKDNPMPIYLPKEYMEHWKPAISRINRFHDGITHRADSIATLVRRLADRAGIHCSPHTLRHTRATHLLEEGKPYEHIQHILGHLNIATTIKYLSAKEEARSALE